MNVRFYNARILTLEHGFDIICGELWTKDGKIYYVGESKTSDIGFDREIDADGNLLMPGFKDAHTHSPMTFLRSFADDLPLHEWLLERIFPMEAQMTPEDHYAPTILAVMEYLSGGITSVMDMYYQPATVAKAFTDCGFRAVLVGVLNNFKESVPLLEQYYNTFNHYNPLITYQLGFHAEYTTSTELMKELSALSHKLKAPVFVHSSETTEEVALCLERYDKTPTELFDGFGLFDYGGAGYHSAFMTDNDIDIYVKKNIFAVTNPASNMKLASGVAPVCKLLNAGVKMSIGTDGAASNNCLDMFREMFLTTGLQKIQLSDAAACPAEDVVYMATVGGSHTLGLDNSDTLAVGKNADLIMIDLHRPNMQPINNIVKNLVYSGSKENVKMTMIDGKILYENGNFYIGCDSETIYAQVNDITKKIAQKAEEHHNRILSN